MLFCRGRRPRRPVSRGSTYRPVGWGPCAPPPGTHFSAGHMGPALQRKRIPAKTTRRPARGAARFPSMCGTDGGGLYSPLYASGNRGGFHLKAERALTYLETTYHVFCTSLLHNFNKNMETRVFRSHVKAIKRHKQPLCPLIASPPKGRRGLGKGY